LDRREDSIIECKKDLKIKDNTFFFTQLDSANDWACDYCAIFVCKTFNIEKVSKDICRNSNLGFDKCLNILREKLFGGIIINNSDDYWEIKQIKIKEEVDVNRYKICKFKLICLITLKRIKTPVKRFHWRHTQWFDIDSFLELN